MSRKHPSLSLRSTAYQRGGIAAGSRRYTGDGHVIRGGEKDTLEMARSPVASYKLVSTIISMQLRKFIKS